MVNHLRRDPFGLVSAEIAFLFASNELANRELSICHWKEKAKVKIMFLCP